MPNLKTFCKQKLFMGIYTRTYTNYMDKLSHIFVYEFKVKRNRTSISNSSNKTESPVKIPNQTENRLSRLVRYKLFIVRLILSKEQRKKWPKRSPSKSEQFQLISHPDKKISNKHTFYSMLLVVVIHVFCTLKNVFHFLWVWDATSQSSSGNNNRSSFVTELSRKEENISRKKKKDVRAKWNIIVKKLLAMNVQNTRKVVEQTVKVSTFHQNHTK